MKPGEREQIERDRDYWRTVVERHDAAVAARADAPIPDRIRVHEKLCAAYATQVLGSITVYLDVAAPKEGNGDA